MRAIQLIPTIVLGLVIAGLVVTAGVKVIANFRSDAIESLDSTSITYEIQTASLTTITPTYVAAGGILNSLTSICVGKVGDLCASLTIGIDANASTGYRGTGEITINSNMSGNRSNISYSYSAKDAVLNATVDSMKGTTEISDQFSTIGIISAMVIILMMIGGLTAYFGLR